MTGSGVVRPSQAGDLRYDAVVLAGGAARRLGGVDKPAQRIGGRSLLDRVLDAVPEAGSLVVVGPERATDRPVRWTREPVPGSGPAAALAAGLELTASELVVALAADLPFLPAEVVRRLVGTVAGQPGLAGAVLADGAGAPQWLVGAWRRHALRGALSGVAGGSLRAVLAPLGPRIVTWDEPADAPPWYDCDDPQELRQAEAWT